MKKASGAVLYSLKFILLAAVLIFTSIGSAYLRKSCEDSRDVLSRNEDDSGITIVLDPGHGGKDGGATALSSIPEKDLNLDISLCLRDMLCAAGFNVVMTRTSDVMLEHEGASSKKNGDLMARKEIAQSVDNAVFISIHMNSFPIERYYGLQVYYSGNNELAKSLAASIQSTVKRELQPSNTRQIKSAGESIYLLDRLTCPAVLVECGFLSNEKEASDLNDPEYRRELAFLIFCSIGEFLSENV